MVVKWIILDFLIRCSDPWAKSGSAFSIYFTVMHPQFKYIDQCYIDVIGRDYLFIVFYRGKVTLCYTKIFV